MDMDTVVLVIFPSSPYKIDLNIKDYAKKLGIKNTHPLNYERLTY